MEDITGADYAYAKRVCKDFEIKNLGEYHGLYVQSDMLLLADVFENFQNMCLEIYVLDPKGLKYLNDSKDFIEYSNDMDESYKNIEEYNPNKNVKWYNDDIIDDVIADMLSNKKLNLIVTELFIRGRKLNISFVFISQSSFAVPKNIRLNSMQLFYYETSKQLTT